ncbi:MAG: cation:proton antiporter [Actinomycetota bacterium]
MNVDLVLLITGGMLFVLGLLSAVLKRVFLTTVLAALLLGVILGPEVLDIIDPVTAVSSERRVLEGLARITLAVTLMSAGLQVGKQDLKEQWRRVLSLLTVGMFGMWFVTALGAYLLLPIPLWMAVLIGAILTPTDPVVASTLVTGRMAKENLTPTVRRSLQLESASNDGLALPLVLIAIAFAPGQEGLGYWAFEALKEVTIGVAMGTALGFGAGKALEVALHRWDIEHASLVTLGLALALGALGSIHLVGGSGVLGVFVASLVFSLVVESELRDELEEIEESLVNVLILPVFTFFGAMLPWHSWSALGAGGVLFALWAVFLRRPFAAWGALSIVRADRRERVFLSWFGPMGVAALYYALLVETLGISRHHDIFAVASLAICLSVVVHSLTATPGIRLFKGRSMWTTLRHPLSSHIEQER